MANVISIDGAMINSDDFTKFLQRGLSVLDSQREATLDFKEIVEEASEKMKIDKKVVSKFFKARFKDTTKAAIKDGELFAALNQAIDG